MGSVLRPLVLGLVLMLAGWAGAHARPFTAEDLVKMDRLTEAQASRDGRLIAYNVRSVVENDRVVNALWVKPVFDAEKPARMLVSGITGGTQPQWSPDGRFIYYLAVSGGLRQVFRIPADGSKPPVQITRLPLSINWLRLSPTGVTLVVSIDVYPDCPTLECTRDRLVAEAGKSPNMLYRDVGMRYYDEWEDGLRFGLFAVSAAGGPAIPLTRGLVSDVPNRPYDDRAAYTISPDNRWVVFAALASGVSNSESPAQDLYRVRLDGKAPPEKLGVDEGGSAYAPTFSPDGRRLAFLWDRVAKSDGMRAALKVRAWDGAPARTLGAGVDRSPQKIAWARDGKSVYAIAEDAGQQRLFAYDLDGGRPRPMTGDGTVEDFDATPQGAVYLGNDYASPTQAFVTAGGPGRKLTEVGSAQLAGVEMAPYESFTFAGWNGETVQGFVVEPLNREPGKTYPVVMVVHGGPHGAYNNNWSYLRSPQVWSGKGYATLLINFHGSTGFGEVFSQSVHGHWGDRPLEDLQKGWAAALERYRWIDAKRACALGSSYGGYMVNWIAGVWNEPWRCLVSHAGVFDVRAGGLSGDLVWYKDVQLGGSPVTDPEAFERFNPRNHITSWTKPILFTHGGRDLRVTINESVSGHVAAQRMGIPSELLYMPDANHSVIRPQDMRDWYATVDAWIDRWTAPDAASKAKEATQ